MAWFDVNKEGLSRIMERRGKAWALFELIQNAWDSGATVVEVTLEPVEGVPFVRVVVADNSAEGWEDLSDAFVMFGKSRRSGDASKRGRFCLGEKMVLSICRFARISTTSGTVHFNADGSRRQSKECRILGTEFDGEVRMTRDELREVMDAAEQLIPPAGVATFINGNQIIGPKLLRSFQVTLPTMIADDDGNFRKSSRATTVNVYAAGDGEPGQVLEMGIPVCDADFAWRLDVGQKVPLNMERDAVSDAFRKALTVAAVNVMADTIQEEAAAEAWVTEAIGDARINPDALKTVFQARFGERAVVAVPGDPVANAQAEANGYSVIHGGALPGAVWANVRKAQFVPTTSQTFPTMKPAERADAAGGCCPMCGSPIG